MTRPMVRIHDLATDEIIDREMNEQEFSQHQKDLLAESKRESEEAAIAAKKDALLSKLGITADEAKLLLG